jgi:hypothetical protein
MLLKTSKFDFIVIVILSSAIFYYICYFIY